MAPLIQKMFGSRTLRAGRWLACLLLAGASAAALADENDYFETFLDGSTPQPLRIAGVTPAREELGQPVGSLTGRVVFTSGGHGWTWSDEGWFTQRGVGHEMNEDYGNLDQMNYFVRYAFNAGATVVAFRPVGYQTNEVVLDNTSSDVVWNGAWYDSRSEIYYGEAGRTPYRFARLSNLETATATYAPRIPQAGYYPVYTWARHGADRTRQLYKIRHTGGETLLRIPHQQVGSGWVYLGTYYFGEGRDEKRGAVVISNLLPQPETGRVAVADAIRFGNGMGDIVPEKGAPLSSYPREEESSRYWVMKGLGQGQSKDIYSSGNTHQSSNVGSPPRMAKVMNRETEGNIFKRIFISFHSNAGGGAGTTALWNNPELFPGTKTPNQERLAELVGKEVNDAFGSEPLLSRLEKPWSLRTRLTYAREDYAFGEINNRYIQDEFDATILEVAFHDHAVDAPLLRDPKVRDWTARSAYRAVVRYMHEFDGLPVNFLPEPPQNVSAVATTDGIKLTWEKPAADVGNEPTGYAVYWSEDGYGFGQRTLVEGGNNIGLILQHVPERKATDGKDHLSAMQVTTNGRGQVTVLPAHLPAGQNFFFRIAAVNAGGESLPSAVVGCQREKHGGSAVLYVNGFTEVRRENDARQTIKATHYNGLKPEGEMDRAILHRNNAGNYVASYGPGLTEFGRGFDTVTPATVAAEHIALTNYAVVIWAAGNETKPFSEETVLLLDEYLRHGGRLLLSGSKVVGGLTELGQPGQTFLGRYLGARWLTPEKPLHTLAEKSLLLWRSRGDFGLGKKDDYFVKTADIVLPGGPAEGWLRYDKAQEGFAGIRQELDNGGKVIFLGFPLETVSSPKVQTRLLEEALDWLD